ncbi:MAG: 50S ribosomal protein L16 [Candidatus Omnitrophica bacterium]|nr:50S ribosomal protein L16 [Candidatus Omnitrophota bacterium]
MSLMPKRVKFRKMHRGWMNGLATKGNQVSFGEYGIKAIDRGMLTATQIEAARVALTRHVKRGGKVWLRVFPDKPYTKKPAEVRMGKGKGSPEYYIAKIKPGRVIFEMAGVPEALAKSALRLCSHKMPFKTKFVKRAAI